MKKILLCSFCLLSIFVFGGCSNPNNVSASVYQVQTIFIQDNYPPVIDKQKIYINKDKYRIEHNTNDKDKALSRAIDIFDGQNLYSVFNIGNINSVFKDDKHTKEQILESHSVYALLNWNKYNRNNAFNTFNKNSNSKNTIKTKSKYGFDCSLYEYNWKECNKFGACWKTTRKVCVNEKNNMAVSILNNMVYENSNAKSELGLELVKLDTKSVNNNIFNLASIKNYRIEKEKF